MLILSRKVGEQIVIGEDAEVQISVMALNGRIVRLGITAPKDMRVDRLEVRQRIMAQEGMPALAQQNYGSQEILLEVEGGPARPS